MKYPSMNTLMSALLATMLAAAIAGCGNKATTEPAITKTEQQGAPVSEQADTTTTEATNETPVEETAETNTALNAVASLDAMSTGGVIDTADLFTERDLEQSTDLVGATYLSLVSGQDVTVSEGGVYVLVGDVEDVTVTVDADGEKVQLVLDGVTITNADFPALYVKAADKVFITTAKDSENTLSVTGSFVADGDTNTDAVIFSKDDLVLNGLGTLTVNSTENGITSKDDLKVTGGAYVITSAKDALEANDSIRIADGSLAISTSKDGLHAENDDDDSLGYIYICGGTLSIDSEEDGIQGTTYVQIDGGTIDITASEAIEGTYVQVNGGTLTLNGSDDGINASAKSQAVGVPTIEITGGSLSITMAQGDTDALDANGYLYVRGGTIDINAQFPFDFDYGSEFTGGTITVNGEQVSEITESMMMGGMGGPGGMMGGPGGGPGAGQGGGPGGW